MDTTAPKQLPEAPPTPPISGDSDMSQEKEFPVNLEAFPGLDESKVIEWSKKCNEAWEKFFTGGMSPEDKRIQQYNKMFMCQNNDSRQPHLPIPNSIIETLHANVMQVMSKRPKVVEAKSKFITADNEKQRLIEDLVNQEILFQEDARKKISGIIKQASISEYAIVKSLWENYTIFDINPQYVAPTGINMVVDTREIEIQRGRWVYEQIPQLNFAFDPSCITSLSLASWTRHRDWKAISELLKMQQEGKLQNIDTLADRATESKPSDKTNKLQTQKEALGEGRQEGPEKKIQIDEFYAVISWEGPADNEQENKWMSERFHFMVANNDILILFDKCGLKPDRNPYILVRVATRPDSLIGNSTLLPVVDLEDQANRSTTQKRDLVGKAADNPGFYEPASGFDPSKLRGRTGGWHMVANAKAITRLEVDSEPIRILNEDISSMVQMMRESTPANEQFQGNGPEQNTATQANLDYQAGGTRFAEIVDTISNDLFPQLAREFFWQAKQFSQDGDLFVSKSSIDGTAKKITLMDLTGDWDFIASSMTTEANRKSENAGKMEALNQLLQWQTKAPQVMIDAQGNQVHFDIIGLYKDEILPATGIRTGKSYIVTVPMPPPIPQGQGMPPGGPGGPPGMPPQGPMPGMQDPGVPPQPHPTPGQPLPQGVA